MSEEKDKVTFEDLYKRDISKYVEKLEKRYQDKKTKQWKSFYLSYLSWAYGHREMKRIDPDAKEHVHTFPLVHNGQVIEGVEVPYLQTPQGFFVQSTVTINGRSETEWLPVLDNSNKPVQNPNSFQINTSNKRCFVKALAKHGLGLYLYVGEDLPENISDNQAEPQPNQQHTAQQNLEPEPTQAQLEAEGIAEINGYKQYLISKGIDLEAFESWVAQQEKVNRIEQVELKRVLGFYKSQALKLRNEEAKTEAEQRKQEQAEQTSLMQGNTTSPINWGN